MLGKKLQERTVGGRCDVVKMYMSAQRAWTSVSEGKVMKISVTATKLFNSPFQITV